MLQFNSFRSVILKNGKLLKGGQAFLKGNFDSISKTIFGELVDSLKNEATYSITNVRAGKYMSQRLLLLKLYSQQKKQSLIISTTTTQLMRTMPPKYVKSLVPI